MQLLKVQPTNNEDMVLVIFQELENTHVTSAEYVPASCA